jgi:hypothetical protein
MKLHLPTVAPGLLKTQAQPRMLGQPVFLVQKPWQVVWKGRNNWRAETVPAQRTAAAIPVRIMVLIVLLPMSNSFRLHAQPRKDEYVSYFAGG